MPFLKFFLLVFGVCILTSNTTLAETKVLEPSDNLGAEIEKSKAGDTLLLRPGIYNGGLTITNKRATSNNPIIIKNKGDGPVIISGDGRKRALLLQGTSYLAFEGIRFENGNYEGVYVQNSAHIIFIDCQIKNTQGAGLKIGGRYKTNNTLSHHIDWIGGEIQNTGNAQGGAYGESIYIGQAQQAKDYTHDIWIEGVRIFLNNGSEAIDIKPEAYNITLINNDIHDINPRIHFKSNGENKQTNDSAININGGNDMDRFSNIWIEGNKIRNITSNFSDRANGIAILNNPGVIALNNEIKDVQGAGIRVFTCCNLRALDYMNYIINNNISNTGRGSLDINNKKVKIETRPSFVPASIYKNRPSKQTWYNYKSNSYSQ